MKIGYARTSQDDPELVKQIAELQSTGCERLFLERLSTKATKWKELTVCLESIAPKDILVITNLERIGKSLQHLFDTIQYVNNKGAFFISLEENIDTSGPLGQVFIVFFTAISKFNRAIIQERIQAGLSAAREGGRLIGRPVTIDADLLEKAKKLYATGKYTLNQVADAIKISRTTLYRYLTKNK